MISLENPERKKEEKAISNLNVQIKKLELEQAELKHDSLAIELFLIDLGVTEEILSKIAKGVVEKDIPCDELNKIIEKVEYKYLIDENFLAVELNFESEEDYVELVEIVIYCLVNLARSGIRSKKLDEEISELRTKKIELQKKLVSNIETERKYKELLNNDE